MGAKGASECDVNGKTLVSQCFLNCAGSLAATEKDIDFVDLNF